LSKRKNTRNVIREMEITEIKEYFIEAYDGLTSSKKNNMVTKKARPKTCNLMNET